MGYSTTKKIAKRNRPLWHYVEGTVEKFYIAKFDEDKDNNGNLIPPYETVFVLEKTKDGKERSINMVMPCEDEK